MCKALSIDRSQMQAGLRPKWPEFQSNWVCEHGVRMVVQRYTFVTIVWRFVPSETGEVVVLESQKG